jgi:hypothetical protein
MAATNRHLVLQRLAAITSVMDSSDQVTLQLPYLKDKKLWTLRRRSFSGCGREPDTIIFNVQGSQYFVYEWLQ